MTWCAACSRRASVAGTANHWPTSSGGGSSTGDAFAWGPGVLIPRPETEHLVEVALERCPAGPLVDVGTGSGIVALTVALENDARQSPVLGIDCSAAALDHARRNRELLGPADVAFVRGDLLAPLRSAPCLAGVLANLPYVEPRDLALLAGDVRDHEPEMALVPRGERPASIRRRLLEQAARRLIPGGLLALEVGAGQAGQARDDLLAHGFREIGIHNDLAGIGRIVSAAWPGGVSPSLRSPRGSADG